MDKVIPNGWLQYRGGPPGGTIIDVGAHEGGYTHGYARWVGPTGVVHAIEPGPPPLFQKLKDRVALYPWVQCHNIGLADRTYKAERQSYYHAWVIGPAGGYGGLAPSPEGGVFDVAFTTFDDFMEQHNVARPGLVKIDVDGHEVKVLRGARKRLLAARVPMYFEFSFLPKNCGDTVEELIALIFDAGYWVFPLLPERVLEVLRTPQELLAIFPWNTSWDASLVHQDDPMLKTLGRGL